MIERATQALIAELHRQGKARGVVVEDNGVSAQVDGSFPVEPLVRAVIAAIREPSDAMLKQDVFSHFSFDADGLEDNEYLDDDQMRACWQAMIAALLEEGADRR